MLISPGIEPPKSQVSTDGQRTISRPHLNACRMKARRQLSATAAGNTTPMMRSSDAGAEGTFWKVGEWDRSCGYAFWPRVKPAPKSLRITIADW